MTANPLVVERTDTTSPLAGTLLLEDGEQLVHAVQNGDWVSGGLALFTGALDTVAAVSDPLGTLFAMGIGWVIDHVEPLNSWLEDLTGDGDQVRAFAGTWANVSSHLQQQADELTRVVTADLAGMDGATITAYRQLAADMAEHMGGASRWAGSMSTALEVAATLVQIVHDIVRDAIAQVLGAVASYAAELIFTAGLATPLVIEQAATRAAALAARIGSYVTRLLTSFRNLDELLSGLRRLFDDLGRLFDDLFRGGRGPDAPRTPDAPRGDGATPPTGPTGPGRTPPGGDPGTPTGPSVPTGPVVSGGPDVPGGPGAGAVPGGGGAPGGTPVRPGPDAQQFVTPDADLVGGRPGAGGPDGGRPGEPDAGTTRPEPDPVTDPTTPDPTTPDPTVPDPGARPLPDGATAVPDRNPDPHYGEPRTDAGTSFHPDNAPATHTSSDVAKLGGDAAHPWGTNPDTGRPFTEKEFLERFTRADGTIRWPPNDGAVPGSKHEFTSTSDFRNAYGDGLDRVGLPDGSYLGFPPGAPWGDRALFPSSLDDPVDAYRLAGDLPDGWRIQVSEIAPAFGQPGGGMQVLVFNDKNKTVPVTELINAGILQ
ncbi:glycohydrolase toxin TNT-related protein [Cellulomonas sp.]|uniref:glycohydrolase toxin TNT-related protein n=1 Tax=Cellulomonas sp. TaxID=40001 RepID=UPI002811E4FB|nr:glycohydrolase toxin TNT-related protein [Cellulomonas sp.]